jgi:hypothetical protein
MLAHMYSLDLVAHGYTIDAMRWSHLLPRLCEKKKRKRRIFERKAAPLDGDLGSANVLNGETDTRTPPLCGE